MWLVYKGNLFVAKAKKKKVAKKIVKKKGRKKKKVRGHPDLNRGPLDLQSNALPLSYTPTVMKRTEINYSY